MQYMFTCLVLGDPYAALNYLHEGGLENTSQGEISIWQTHKNYGEDECDIEFNVPVLANADFDDLVPRSDGVIYFLNPNSADEVIIFKELMTIIQKMRRDIPTIIIFKDRNGLIQYPSNTLLNWIWEDYSFEAFVADYFSANELNEIIDTMTRSIMYGDILINYDTAWLQFPFLMKKANQKILEKEWAVAARMVEKLAKMAKQFERDDWTIFAEKAAWLYAEARNFLSAANIIKSFNPVFSERYRRMYFDFLLHKGHEVFREKKFADAAEIYQQAGRWASIELSDHEMMKQGLKLAIYSWVAACEVQNAFDLVDKFNHDEMVAVLEEITEKIAGAADFLSNNGQNEHAKTQLYLSFQRYQKAGLFNSIKVLATKAIKVLKRILEGYLAMQDVNSAKMTLDEIYNIWDTYEIPTENLDTYLVQVGKLFIIERDFPKVEVIIPKIASSEFQREITQARMDEEEKIKNETKEGELQELTHAMRLLLEYVKEEGMQLYELNKQVFAQADRMLINKDFIKAAEYIKRQADWLKSIGHDQLSFDVLEKVFETYLKANLIARFSNEINFIPEQRRKSFLSRNQDQILNSFREIQKKLDPIEFENLITTIIRYYRNHLLYEESKEFADLLIDYLIDLASKIAAKGDQDAINQSLDTIHKIETIAKSSLEGKKLNFDPIFSKVVEFYIKVNNLKDARAYNEKIIDKQLAGHFFSMLDKIETQQSTSQTSKAKEAQEKKMLADQLSQLQNSVRDQRSTQEDLLRMRTGLKKRYFNQAIECLMQNKPTEAAKLYCDTTKELAKTKKYELAGISAAVGALIQLMLKDFRQLKNNLQDLENTLEGSSNIFHSTFAVKLIDYVVNSINSNLPEQMKGGLKLFEVLALFPEEKIVLESLLGDQSSFQEILSKHKEILTKENNALPSNYSLLIEKVNLDPAAISKRRALEIKLWGPCQDHFARQDYEQASNTYLHLIDELKTRNLDLFAITSVIMGFLVQLKYKSPSDAYRELEKYMFKLEKEYESISKTEMMELLDIFLQHFEDPNGKNMIGQIGDVFLSKLPLFDWEISFLNPIIGKVGKADMQDSSAQAGITPSGIVDLDDDTLLSQQLIVLTQMLSNIKGEITSLREKREKLVRMYFTDIFTDIAQEKYVDAAQKYISLSKRMARRNDYDQASLMILLAVLSEAKAGKKISDIKKEMDENLQSLGIVKKILEESFGIKVALFLIDALQSNSDSIRSHLRELLDLLPILENEKKIVEIF